MNKEELKEMTKISLTNECLKIIENYMKVYDEYYSDNQTRESAFLKGLIDSLLGISAVLEVYTEHGKIYPSYAIEKLKFSKSFIDAGISFFESKLGDDK